MNLLPFAFSFPEWICRDDDGLIVRGCGQKVAWVDAILVEEGPGRLVAVLHRECVQ